MGKCPRRPDVSVQWTSEGLSSAPSLVVPQSHWVRGGSSGYDPIKMKFYRKSSICSEERVERNPELETRLTQWNRPRP